jgi:hypothetical protein
MSSSNGSSGIEGLEKRFRGFAINAGCTYLLLTLFQGATQPLREEKERAKRNWTQWAEENDVGRKFGEIKL